ncbi:MAG: anti-sigma factor family protein [Paracoccaceae bacterium]
MMRDTVIDKDRLAAFADGELSPEDAAAVVMHLADHPEDQAFVDNLVAANAALAQAFAAPMNEPVPPAILAAIEGRTIAPSAKVVAFPRWRTWAMGGFAVAASVVLAVALSLGPPDQFLAVGPVPTGTQLHSQLQRLPSGQTITLTSGADLTILASLPTASGHCREVEVIDRRAARLDTVLACQSGTGWRIEVAVSEALRRSATDQVYVPAAGAETPALTPWLDQFGAGIALDPTAEANAIAAGWTP